MSDVAVPVAAAPARATRAPLPGFHFGLAILMTAIVGAGFRPFYAALLTGGAGADPVIYAHAAVFTGWAYVQRRVHRIYWVGLAVFLVSIGRAALMEAEPWLIIGRRIITAFLPA